jgi:hypothetical protein
LILIDPSFIAIPLEANFGPAFSLFNDFVALAVKQLRNHFTLVIVLFSHRDDPQMADTVFQVG